MIKMYLIYLIVVALLPTILARIFHYQVICYNKNKLPFITITFDDGPDPVYTPVLLSLLDKYNIKACFFLLADKAQKYPDLAREIVKRGHEIGIHGYKHHVTWLLGPKATYSELLRSAEILKNITGKYPVYYRPPWGLFTTFIYRYSRKLGMKIILWSYMSWDWKSKDPEIIVKKVLNKVTGGNILIFHDSSTNIGSDSEAPKTMIQALDMIIQGLEEKNFEIVDINEFICSAEC